MAKNPAPRWSANQVEQRRTADLVPSANNAREHSPEQVALIASSIERFGWTMPVLIDEAGTIIAGHGRVLAARKLGIAECPVIVASGWDAAEKRAYVLADNQIALRSGWNEPLLRQELADLEGFGFDPVSLGFEPLPEPKVAGSMVPVIEDSPMRVSFWLSVEGPFARQPEALAAVRTLAGLPGVTVHSNLKPDA